MERSRRMAREPAFPTRLLRYGPFHFPEKLIPLMIVTALHGRSLPVYGAGRRIRDWHFVEDPWAAIDRIPRALVDRFLACPAARGTSGASLVTYVPDRPGFETLSTGLARTVDYSLTNDAWWLAVMVSSRRTRIEAQYGQ